MPVLFVVNRSSGAGRAARLSERFARAFDAAGQPYQVRDAHHPIPDGHPPEQYYRQFSAIAAVGGDGTLHHLLDHACRAGVPLYHIPAGNENLFAREFGMNADPHRLLRELERGVSRSVDVPTLDGRPFALMHSCGPDAGVIHRLHEVRCRASGHAMYLRPILSELLGPRMAHVSVRADGREIVTRGCGLLITANSRHYASRLNPAPQADMADGLLDAVFFPARSTASVLLWGIRFAAGEQLASPQTVHARARTIEVTAHARTPMQYDGEAAGWLEPGQTVRLSVSPGALRVLTSR